MREEIGTLIILLLIWAIWHLCDDRWGWSRILFALGLCLVLFLDFLILAAMSVPQ